MAMSALHPRMRHSGQTANDPEADVASCVARAGLLRRKTPRLLGGFAIYPIAKEKGAANAAPSLLGSSRAQSSDLRKAGM